MISNTEMKMLTGETKETEQMLSQISEIHNHVRRNGSMYPVLEKNFPCVTLILGPYAMLML